MTKYCETTRKCRKEQFEGNEASGVPLDTESLYSLAYPPFSETGSDYLGQSRRKKPR